MLYWLPQLHKTPYNARFIANSISCTTTEFSKLLTSCLTAVKKHVIKYCEKVYERSGLKLFWSITNAGEILDKLFFVSSWCVNLIRVFLHDFLFDLILYVHSTIFQLCGTGLPGLNQY